MRHDGNIFAKDVLPDETASIVYGGQQYFIANRDSSLFKEGLLPNRNWLGDRNFVIEYGYVL